MLFLAMAFMWNALDLANLAKSMASSGSHTIEIYKIDKDKSRPFRVLSIEGERFHHPPEGHTKLFLHFDKSPNERLIFKLRKQARETYAYQSDADWEDKWEETEWDD